MSETYTLDTYGWFKLYRYELHAEVWFRFRRDFPRSDLGPNKGPFSIQKRAKNSKNCVYPSQFLVLHFGEDFMKLRSKKLCMHEKLHKNVNESMFSFTFLCNSSCVFYGGQ